MTYFIWACLLGGLSALSLPLGSLVGLKFKFSNGQISFMAAFGAGALLAALSVELIAPTTLALVDGGNELAHDPKAAFYAMIIGCVLGGIIYVLLDKAVNKGGGFLRKTSSLLQHYQKAQKEEKEEMLNEISKSPLFQNFPSEHINILLESLIPHKFKKGDRIIKEGDPTTQVYLILEGSLKMVINGEDLGDFTANPLLLGIVDLMYNSTSTGTATALNGVKALSIDKVHFNKLRELIPSFDEKCKILAKERIEEFRVFRTKKDAELIQWTEKAKDAITTGTTMPDIPFIKKKSEEHSGSPLAIWLGILLDGIPESMVIGAGMLGRLTAKLSTASELSFVDVVPFTLIAGLFLSNFPEALSSSTHMVKSGMSKKKVFSLWFSLMIMTAIGAGVGYLIAGEVDHTFMVLLEGLAAGAMLTMIASAMIPEAVIMGTGNLVGLSTLAGFLSAILFKLLE